jgi:hypothetical protein
MQNPSLKDLEEALAKESHKLLNLTRSEINKKREAIHKIQVIRQAIDKVRECRTLIS